MPTNDSRSGAAALGCMALIAVGLWWLLRSTGFISAAVLDLITESVGALTLIALGVIVVVFSRKGRFARPREGTQLYRSRTDRWLGGVLGGLGAYLGIEPLLLRVAVVLLTVLGAGILVPAYIVMWIFVPEEPFVPFPQPPVASAAPTAPPEAPVAPAQPPIDPTAPTVPPTPPVPPTEHPEA